MFQFKIISIAKRNTYCNTSTQTQYLLQYFISKQYLLQFLRKLQYQNIAIICNTIGPTSFSAEVSSLNSLRFEVVTLTAVV